MGWCTKYFYAKTLLDTIFEYGRKINYFKMESRVSELFSGTSNPYFALYIIMIFVVISIC